MKLIIKTITNLNFVLFGALGDLALRKLYISLFILYKKNLINNQINILCLARKLINVNNFRSKIYKLLIKNKYMNKKKELIHMIHFIKCLYYLNIDFINIKHYKYIKNWLLKNKLPLVFYLSVSSNLFKIICKYLNLNKCLMTNSKIILEKPIGCNLKSSININNYINNIFYDNCIFRIDHYLGKRQVKNLLYLRFLNPIFYNIWNKKYITHIKISLAENLGIEDRWGYFDKTGQLRDMVQNHLIQILSMITICVPKQFDYKNIYQEKIKLLKDLNNSFLTVDINYGQYISNKLNKKIFNGYLEDKNSNKNSSTETFISINTKINNFYWYGIPFILISGKRLKKKISQIKIYFNKHIFNYEINNNLIINLQPKEDINIVNKFNCNKLFFNNKKSNKLDSYDFLILEVIKGKQDLFVSKEEIDYSWRWIDKLIYLWKQKNMPIYYYKSFTWGPIVK
ncbi:Glucose-6-phosphate 1-dehydrogenase [Candidatus Portiera aleyrodidarum]|uniref:Glucose-6-phosphate 1-dehydrogenase n=1 Tax=Candidatus Portiera aleyrodidarum TV TaxID=1297582 RepID=A0A8D3X876_9GAMM|nr:glucose-6-phosphate dehydrogenase [Candidatus Portiera aleyrodidarum]AGI27194.1 glucose-6-phosphate 1-dehydrogenase [Candidatus Portiera aleyrodidarum TV]CEI59178.1 Glucose-6-phosphate 1-dehydrogenase [Candidatus Portiera aleyrodidarum]